MRAVKVVMTWERRRLACEFLKKYGHNARDPARPDGLQLLRRAPERAACLERRGINTDMIQLFVIQNIQWIYPGCPQCGNQRSNDSYDCQQYTTDRPCKRIRGAYLKQNTGKYLG